MRRLFGPLANRKVHNPRFGNIFTGVPESKTHHNKEVGKARVSGDFFGRNATYGYCPVWGDVHGRWEICGREMCIKSPGCGVHGREGMEIYQLQAKGEPIPGRLMVDPKLIEQREEEEAENRRQDEQIEKAENSLEDMIKSGVSVAELEKKFKETMMIQSEASKSRKAKALAAKIEATEPTIDEQAENQHQQGAKGNMNSRSRAKKRGFWRKKKH